MIETDYLIHPNTLAILPGKAIDHDTRIIENQGEVKVRQKALKLINHACIHYAWVTYQGRIQAVTTQTGFKHKIAVPISNDLILFPTASPTHMDNVWLNHQQIDSINKIDASMSQVVFKNGETIQLPVSYYALNQQNNRAYEINYRMTHALTAKIPF